ncbi:hypothetical protein WYI_20084 [Ochrobactrum sp. CDB2]|nr:hypothetical protein WYI_20084 [Ochrobactrum sp. CDB2]
MITVKREEGVMSDTMVHAVRSRSQTSDVRKVVFASLIGSTIEWYDFFFTVWWPVLCSTTCIFHRIMKPFPS